MNKKRKKNKSGKTNECQKDSFLYIIGAKINDISYGEYNFYLNALIKYILL